MRRRLTASRCPTMHCGRTFDRRPPWTLSGQCLTYTWPRARSTTASSTTVFQVGKKTRTCTNTCTVQTTISVRSVAHLFVENFHIKFCLSFCWLGICCVRNVKIWSSASALSKAICCNASIITVNFTDLLHFVFVHSHVLTKLIRSLMSNFLLHLTKAENFF